MFILLFIGGDLMETIAQISYKENVIIKAEELSEVFKSSGIKRPSDDLNRLQRMIENSGVLITAWDNHRLIGVARAITDYSYCCYLSDLAVNKDYQNKGIGRELIRLVQEKLVKKLPYYFCLPLLRWNTTPKSVSKKLRMVLKLLERDSTFEVAYGHFFFIPYCSNLRRWFKYISLQSL